MQDKTDEIGLRPSRTSVDYYCFSLPAGYRDEVNMENLRKVGIKGPHDVGRELVKMFHSKLDQKDLAKRLSKFIGVLDDQHSCSPSHSVATQ